MSLYHAIFEHDVEHILYETGILLKKGETDAIEDAWIQTLGNIAEHLISCEGKVFTDVLKPLSRLLEQEQLVIRDAFVMSVKLSFLLKRIKKHARGRPSIQKLRDKVKGLFPEKAALSAEGLKTFAKVLPSSSKSEEYAFAQRIIAGLSKIWTEGKHDDSRNCLEYLSRRQLSVNDDSDMVDFLWGVAAVYFKGDENVATTYNIFSWNETKKTRKQRLGLLWGLLYWVQAHSENVATVWWTDEELQILGKITEKYKDLWDQLREDEKDKEISKDLTGIDLIHAFEPRGIQEDSYHEPYQDQRKNIDLTKTKINGFEQKAVKEKSTSDSKSRKNEAYHLDPRYWRVHTSKKGA